MRIKLLYKLHQKHKLRTYQSSFAHNHLTMFYQDVPQNIYIPSKCMCGGDGGSSVRKVSPYLTPDYMYICVIIPPSTTPLMRIRYESPTQPTGATHQLYANEAHICTIWRSPQ